MVDGTTDEAGDIRTRVLSIVGSTRRESRTRALIDIIDARLRRLAVENIVWSLGDRPLPMMDPVARGRAVQAGDRNLATFRTLAATSDAYILGTPVYHDSYSGVLKNALDHLGSADLAGKVFGLVSHGGQRTTQAVSHLQIVVRAVSGLAIPTQICTEDSDFAFDAAGGVTGLNLPALDERIDRFVSELIKHATVYAWLRATPNRPAIAIHSVGAETAK